MKRFFTIFGLLALISLSGVLNAQTTWLQNSVSWPYYSNNLFDVGPYPPTRTVDDDTTTWIYTLNGGTIRYDLGSIQDINSFKYLDGSDNGDNSYPTARFTVSYSNSSSGPWVNVVDTVYSSPSALFGWRYFEFNNVSARYWQVYSLGASNYHSRIYEIGFGLSCTNVTINDTTTYYVSSPEFQSNSPKFVFENTDSLTTTIGGCDSIVHYYSKFIYKPTYYTYTDTTYISVTDTLIIDAVLTGLTPPNNLNTLKIYPNPASTHIYINNGDYTLMNGYTITIENSLSQVVFTSLINQQEFYVDLSSWSGNGLYIVKIIDNSSNVIETKKIIIQ